jgi:hypothetical protein
VIVGGSIVRAVADVESDLRIDILDFTPSIKKNALAVFLT